MDIKYSDLELAINTLVTEFHKAADDQPTMNTTQFQTLVSKQMPAVATAVQKDGGLGLVLQQMEVEGDNISFHNIWTLINSQAVQLFGSEHKEKSTMCSCLQQ